MVDLAEGGGGGGGGGALLRLGMAALWGLPRPEGVDDIGAGLWAVPDAATNPRQFGHDANGSGKATLLKPMTRLAMSPPPEQGQHVPASSFDVELKARDRGRNERGPPTPKKA